MTLSDYKKAIFTIKSNADFKELANFAYQYQRNYNPIFAEWVSYFKENLSHNTRFKPSVMRKVTDFDYHFLPIQFFKNKHLVKDHFPSKTIFTSSGTTGQITSQHSVANLSLYEKSCILSFEKFYGSITNYVILALLPAYLERKGSSLVYMADKFIKLSGKEASGFYLNNYKELIDKITVLENLQQKSILLGVSFALWDLAEQYNLNLQHTIVMETGGMKGRRKEVTKGELHSIFQKGFGNIPIHSEYGMTELLSQAYSKGNNIFECPPWMKIIIRDINDPFKQVNLGETGAINIIDLANIHSCCFIATDDIGKVYPNGSFEVLGRMDNSDIRGCNLMIQDV